MPVTALPSWVPRLPGGTLFFLVAASILIQGCQEVPENGLNNTDLEFSLPLDLQLDTIASEPEVSQPLYLTFDERGRIWVVQYLQYPFPEGLKVVDHDRYWRIQYEGFPPPPPPHGARGRARITILEDQDGDGSFETQKDFLDGLNICSAALPGHGGVWVLNPPYLLFYPDADRDDVPDGPPIVHLEGFGLEDLHSVSNSLLWGPDGWLYGCQGSTTTATIRRPGRDSEGFHFKGQAIWRYHPRKEVFELFAEGGYNNFGIAMDAKGRMYTGTNGGLIGVHYVQGGYYRKSWAKHGALTNPYAFGFFPAMEDHSSKAKISQAMLFYEGGQLPSTYQGTLIAARVLRRRLDVCDLETRGSTYAAREREPILRSPDIHFRPVDLKAGPDGSIYIADWYDSNVTWNVSADADQTDRATGRIYRLSRAGAPPERPFDLARLSGQDLVDLLDTDNKWYRQMAQRILRERRDASLIPQLTESLARNQGQLALETLWALHGSGGFTLELALDQLIHPDPFVRLWTIRLLGDEGSVTPAIVQQLKNLALTETNPQVRSQLASSVRRLPAGDALPILDSLLEGSQDLSDPHIPLLIWWAFEAKLREDPPIVQPWIQERISSGLPLLDQVILPCLGRRFSVDRSHKDLLVCLRLLELATSDVQIRALAQGIAEGLGGAPLPNCPTELLRKVETLIGKMPSDASVLSLAIRLGSVPGVSRALEKLRDPSTSEESRITLMNTLADCRKRESLDLLLEAFGRGDSPRIRSEALISLQHFQENRIAHTLLQTYPEAGAEIRPKILLLLASRVSWAQMLLDSAQLGRIPREEISRGLLAKIEGLADEKLSETLFQGWGTIRQSPEQKLAEMSAVNSMLGRGQTSAQGGSQIFHEHCASCHVFQGKGTEVGPNLSGVDRSDRRALMEAIIDPSSSVLPDFMGFALTVDRGGKGANPQLLEGFVLEENDRTTTIVDSSGNQLTVPTQSVLRREIMQESIMPDGLLHNLKEQEVRDLFAYLQGDE